MITELTSNSDLKAARSLIERNELAFEDGFNAMLGIHENGELIAVGARARNILKMLAVDAAHQGGPILGEILTGLVSSGLAAGFDSLFVFTKPEYSTSFQALNFTLLANQEKVALLEYGHGLRKWLESKRALRHPGINGAVVVNCNPFTNGHRYLLETAAAQVDHLYVFVVKEDRSIFPFDVRYRLLKDGVRDLGNVHVLDTSCYIVSSATFPTYFLKRDDPVARIQMELDVTLFAAQIAPFFGVTRRFVGTEPNCTLTDAYNATMQRLLPVYGIELVVVERKQTSTGVISASRVRELLARDDLTALADYVPAATLAFLRSDEAEAIRRQLRHGLAKTPGQSA